MKINLRNYILIFCLLDIIKTSNEGKTLNKKNATMSLKQFDKKKHLEYNTYYINIYEFTLYNNQLDLIIYYKPQIPSDITFNLTINVRTFNDTYEKWNYPEVPVKINANNITNKYTLFLDNLSENKLKLTQISLQFKNLEIDANYYYIYNPSTKLNIIYFNNEINKNIYITDIVYFKDNINLITYCESKPSENINLLITFSITEYNETSFERTYENEVKLIIDDNSNIFDSILELSVSSGNKYISISKVNIESTDENNTYYIYYPTSTLYISKETSENFVNYPTIKPISISKEYTINISDFSLSGKKLNYSMSCEPLLPNNIYLLLSIRIGKYNSSGNWIYENTGMKLLLNSNSNKFNLISEELSFEDNSEISISNAYLQYNDWYNKYHIYYPYLSINYYNNGDDDYSNNGLDGGNDNGEDGGNDNGEDIVNYPEINNNKSSSKVSIGMIIGIIGGVLVVIGIIVLIIICKCKKAKKNTNDNNNNVNQNNNSNIMNMLQAFNSSSSLVTTNNNTGSIVLKEPKENMRTFIFQTQKQDKEILSIESDKSMKELRKQYLEKINHKELIENNNIFFLFKGKHFTNDTDGLIKDFFNDYENPNFVIVVDNEDEI